MFLVLLKLSRIFLFHMNVTMMLLYHRQFSGVFKKYSSESLAKLKQKGFLPSGASEPASTDCCNHTGHLRRMLKFTF